MWFADPGTRTTGTKTQKFLITGAGWSGTAPEGVTQYTSPTALVWIIGRTYSTGTPQDYKEGPPGPRHRAGMPRRSEGPATARRAWYYPCPEPGMSPMSWYQIEQAQRCSLRRRTPPTTAGRGGGGGQRGACSVVPSTSARR